tara:strand:- start:1444 stop:2400 length:957 start_codon:yes stop_codon:yes gene_type:complete
MDFPLITIGITTYNAEETLNLAVDSALSQNWPKFEVIIIDDCSFDKTWELLNTIKTLHPDINIFQNTQNSGVASSRNKIIQEARGEFIIFFDDDDISMPNRLEQQYKRIIQYEKNFPNNDLIVCHSARLQIYPDGGQHVEQTMGTDENVMAPNNIAVAQRILTGRPLANGYGSTATCSQMARTSTYKKLNGFDPNFYRSEDTDFNIRLAIAGGHFLGIAEPLVIQKMTMTNDKNIQDEKNFTLQLLNKHKDFIQTITSYKACYKWIEIKYDYLAGFKFLFCKKIIKLFLHHPVFVIRRVLWAMPSLSINKRFSKFYEK